MSVNLAALTNQNGGIPASVNLYYTTGGSLPSTAANNSIVLTLDANGNPLTFNGTWVSIPRSGLGPAQCTVGTSSTTNFNDYGFNGWNLNGVAACNTATFFAIVVGFGTLTAANTVDIDSISLVPGNIPCRPGIQSDNAVILDCQRFYEKSFLMGTVPATNLGLGTGEYYGTVGAIAGSNFYLGTVFYKAVKEKSQPVIAIYNPSAANSQLRDISISVDGVGSSATSSASSFALFATGGIGTGDTVVAHWASDARLGN